MTLETVQWHYETVCGQKFDSDDGVIIAMMFFCPILNFRCTNMIITWSTLKKQLKRSEISDQRFKNQVLTKLSLIKIPRNVPPKNLAF
jgi:hypothetical protein